MYIHALLVLYKTNFYVLKYYNEINLSIRFKLIFLFILKIF